MLKKVIPDASEPPSYGKPYAIILVRLFAGFTLFFAGLEKITHSIWSTGPFSASGYLLHSAGGGIFHSWFVSIANIPATTDLVIAGELCIGLAMIFGIFVRFAAIMGIIENGLFWISEYMASNGANPGPFNVGWSNGPLETNAAVIMCYIVSALMAAGLIYGVDAKIHQTDFVKRHPKLKILLG